MAIGTLIKTIQDIITIEHLKPFLKTAEDRITLQSTLNGVEKKPLPHMLAMTNVMLHGIDVSIDKCKLLKIRSSRN